MIIHRQPKIPTWTDNKELNPYVVETAGFVPLEVKFKRFEQAGIKARFSASEFTSADYRDMYLGPNTEIYPEDDLETVTEKLILQEQVKQEILAKKNLQTSELGSGGLSSEVAAAGNEKLENEKELTSEVPSGKI